MKANKIKIGMRVAYYPILGSGEGRKEGIITHGPKEVCGTTCCWIDTVPSCVDIEHLVEIV